MKVQCWQGYASSKADCELVLGPQDPDSLLEGR